MELIIGEAEAKCITADIDQRLSNTVRTLGHLSHQIRISVLLN